LAAFIITDADSGDGDLMFREAGGRLSGFADLPSNKIPDEN